MQLSKKVETTMIVLGLAAGGLATLVWIVWLCLLHRFTAKLAVDEGLPVSTQNLLEENENKRDSVQEPADDKVEVPLAIPLPPPSSYVQIEVEELSETSCYGRKRRYEEMETGDMEQGSSTSTEETKWKVDTHPSKSKPSVKKQITTASRDGIIEKGQKDEVDPFASYDREYQTAFVQREIHSIADLTARWKRWARSQEKSPDERKSPPSS
jgi:hypothetical protein